MNEYNESILRSRVENIDKLISDISVNAIKLSQLEDVNEALTYGKDYTPTQRFMLLKNMRNVGYQLSEQVKYNIVYCHNSELILSGTSVDDAERYYNVYFAPYFDNYDEWKSYISKVVSGTLLRITDKKTKENELIYVYQFNALGRPDCKGTVITQLDSALLFSNADMIEYLEDENGDIIAANVGINDVDNRKEKYNIFKFESKYLDFNYVYLMPHDVFYSPLRTIYVIIILGNILYILISGFLIWYFTNVHSSSVKGIMDTIIKKSDVIKDDNENEYEFIENTLNSLIIKYEESAKNTFSEKQILANSVLTEFVKGEYFGYVPIEELLRRYGVEFKKETFYVSVFHFYGLSELFFEKYTGDRYENYELSKFILQNVFKDVSPQNIDCMFIEINRVLIGVFNISCDDKRLETFIDEMSSILTKKFNIHIKTALSYAHPSVEELPIAYKEATTAFSNRYISDDSILKPIENKENKNYYVYTFEKEQQVIDYMRSGNAEGVKRLISKIITDCHVYGENFEIMTRCVVLDIYATIFKLIGESEIDNNYKKLVDNVHNIGCYEYGDLMEEISEFIDYSLRYIEVREVPKKNIAQRAEEIIQKYYANPDLNVNFVAQKLDVRANYLSSKYKAIRGIALLEFINITRIDKAKELLANTDNKNEDISVSVGFLNVRTFLRVFSKIVGTTPGDYRKKQKSN